MSSFITWCRKYISIPAILIIAAIVFILFGQDYSISNIYHNKCTLDSLEQVYTAWNDTLQYYKDKNRRMELRDPDIIEHIAREQFDMALTTEEVYVFK